MVAVRQNDDTNVCCHSVVPDGLNPVHSGGVEGSPKRVTRLPGLTTDPVKL